MRYYIIAPDGQRYGPGEISMLNEWIIQGRIVENTILLNAATGEQRMARDVPGLIFPWPSHQAPPAVANYPERFAAPVAYPRDNPYTDNGAKDLQAAWAQFGLGLLCCQICFVTGYMSAVRAERKGHPGAGVAKAANGLLLILYVLLTVCFAFGLRFVDLPGGLPDL